MEKVRGRESLESLRLIYAMDRTGPKSLSLGSSRLE